MYPFFLVLKINLYKITPSSILALFCTSEYHSDASLKHTAKTLVMEREVEMAKGCKYKNARRYIFRRQCMAHCFLLIVESILYFKYPYLEKLVY